MATPDLATEGTKAGAVVAIAMLFLKAGDFLLRHGDRKRRAMLADIDQSFEIGARIRMEQQDQIDRERHRRLSSEMETQRVTALNAEMSETLEAEKRLSDARLIYIRQLEDKYGIPHVAAGPPPKLPPGATP